MARKCGNEFDKYLACGSGGENIGIAASGDVICCDNRFNIVKFLMIFQSFYFQGAKRL